MIPALRPYQSCAIDKAREHIAAGRRAPLIVAPTGSGKTTIGAEIARCHVALGGKTLWLAHRQELCDQANERLALFGVTASVVTVQGALSRLRSQDALVPEASLVVLDEAHHYAADEWSELAKRYEASVIVGLSATPERGDGRALGSVFDCIVTAATIRELTELGHLCPLKVTGPNKKLDPGELAQHPVEAYLEHCPGERAVVFVGAVGDALKLAEEFGAKGIAAAVVHGDMPERLRILALKGHEDGTFPVLINVFLLTEGWDSPMTSVCILARGVSTQGALIQMAGRVLRPHATKTRALLLDLPGVCNVFGSPDEDRVYSLSGRGIRRKDGDARFCVVCSALIPEDHEGPCPDCGAEPGGNPRKLTKVVNVPMGDFLGISLGDHDVRSKTLAGLMKLAFSKGYKHGWATAQFRRETGFWPTKKMIDTATKLTRGAA